MRRAIPIIAMRNFKPARPPCSVTEFDKPSSPGNVVIKDKVSWNMMYFMLENEMSKSQIWIAQNIEMQIAEPRSG